MLSYLSLTPETVTPRAALAVSTSTLERTVDQDARRASKIESDDISVLLGEGRQKSEHVSLPKLIIESAQVLALGAGR
jgi:hypothetical protein